MIQRLAVFGLLCFCVASGQSPFEQLKNPDGQVRIDAIVALSKLGPKPEVLAALSESVKDERADVRRLACYLLGRFRADASVAIPVLINALGDTSEEVQAAAAQALGSIGPASAEALPLLVNLLRHRNDDIRRAAAQGLEGLGKLAAPATDDLVVAAGDRSNWVRGTALAALGRIGARLEVVIAALNDPDSSVRRAAVETIPNYSDSAERAIQPLTKALHDPEWTVQASVLGALFKAGRKQPHQVVPAFREALNNPDNKFAIRSGAADYLAAIGEPAKVAIPDLVRALNADHDWVRREARRALKILGADPDALGRGLRATTETSLAEPAPEAAGLIQALRAGDHSVEEKLVKLRGGAVAGLLPLLEDPGPARLAALRVLARIENRAAPAIPAIAKLVRSGDAETQSAAVRALGGIRVPSELAVKTLAYATTQPSLRSEALRAIRGMGANAAGAVPALIPLLKAGDAAVIADTLEALREMATAAEPAVSAMIPLLSSKDAAIRAKTVYAFTNLWAAGTAALPALIQILEDPDPRIRADALFAMHQVFGDCCADRSRVAAEGRKALPRVLELTADPNVEIRQNAVRAVGWIGIAEPAVFQTVVARLRDTSSEVRGTAATALGVLRRLTGKGDDALPPLIAALDDSDTLVRRLAVYALKNFGRAAQPAVSKLEQMAGQSDAEMQRVIEETLIAIRANGLRPGPKENPSVVLR